MLYEPVFVVYCCITAKFEETKTNEKIKFWWNKFHKSVNKILQIMKISIYQLYRKSKKYT